MKKRLAICLALACLLVLAGCGARTMDDIIAKEPSFVGIVEQVGENSLLLWCDDLAGYSNGAECSLSCSDLHPDSMNSFAVGDEVVVYFNGDIAESDPLQIGTVYAITLRTPANRTLNEQS